MRGPLRAAHPGRMSEKTESRPTSESRRRTPAGRAEHNGHHHDHEHYRAGMDLPVFGHVAYTSLGFWAGLGAAGAAGVIDWPVAAAVGVGYALARR
jgi:hypothetical protein